MITDSIMWYKTLCNVFGVTCVYMINDCRRCVARVGVDISCVRSKSWIKSIHLLFVLNVRSILESPMSIISKPLACATVSTGRAIHGANEKRLDIRLAHLRPYCFNIRNFYVSTTITVLSTSIGKSFMLGTCITTLYSHLFYE